MNGSIGMFITLVKDLGFPIVVSGWLLLRMDRLLTTLIEQQATLIALLRQHSGG